jgi:GNAT superfamily N-acetyltransferase
LRARTADGRIVGVGRLHFVDDATAQIRYMATSDHRRGIGTAVVERLEQLAQARGASRVVLNARTSAVPFYAKLGYVITGAGQTLFGEIEHARMEKPLNTPGDAPRVQASIGQRLKG